ncbi:uncharacterized protein LOC127009933 [Eriocheir sinensis]|uniref:uncharacterized protein LOC127009933 n=1 Tax=Eriocheir sinensis TaxID=95602 RepID=UPI0021C89F9D|nr:uncharacterized protein LOC127009933 [Eriocheir sinensis]
MLRCAVLLCLVAVAVAQEKFFEEYSRQKAMTNCVGDELYYSHLAFVEGVKEQCRQQPIFLPVLQTPTPPPTYNAISPGLLHPQVGYNYPAPPTILTHALPTTGYHGAVHGKARTARQASDQLFLNRDAVQGLLGTAHAALSNYTCLMRKVEIVDDNLNIRLDSLQRQYDQARLEPTLRQDLLEGVGLCYQLSRCLPVDKVQSPIIPQLLRLLFFGKCEKQQRTNACFKHDLRRNLFRFDLSALPGVSHEEKLEVLKTVFLMPEITRELSGF